MVIDIISPSIAIPKVWVGRIAELAVETWLKQNNHPYMRAEYIEFEDLAASSVMPYPVPHFVQKTKEFFTQEELVPLHAMYREVHKALKLPAFEKYNGEFGHYVERPVGNKRGSFFPDFVARMPNITFIEVKANLSNLSPNQAEFFRLAKKHGYQTKVARVTVTAAVNLNKLEDT